jgi:hypothetical protein
LSGRETHSAKSLWRTVKPRDLSSGARLHAGYRPKLHCNQQIIPSSRSVLSQIVAPCMGVGTRDRQGGPCCPGHTEPHRTPWGTSPSYPFCVSCPGPPCLGWSPTSREAFSGVRRPLAACDVSERTETGSPCQDNPLLGYFYYRFTGREYRSATTSRAALPCSTIPLAGRVGSIEIKQE